MSPITALSEPDTGATDVVPSAGVGADGDAPLSTSTVPVLQWHDVEPHSGIEAPSPASGSAVESGELLIVVAEPDAWWNRTTGAPAETVSAVTGASGGATEVVPPDSTVAQDDVLAEAGPPAITVLPLSGHFDTERLPRVAPDPVTVIVARAVLPGTEGQYMRWAEEVLSTLREYPGCLGAGLLMPGREGGEYQIVFRFTDGIALRSWERSPERARLMARASVFVTRERVQRTVGVEDWFELRERAEPKRSWWKRVVTDVLWVYPLAIAAAALLTPQLGELPIEARVLVSTAVMTVVTRSALGPLRRRLRARRTL